MPDFSPNTLGLTLPLRGRREFTNSALKKIFFFCSQDKVRDQRRNIEKWEVTEAHILSTEIQQRPLTLFCMKDCSCPGVHWTL